MFTKPKSFLLIAVMILAAVRSSRADQSSERYLAFQIFTASHDTATLTQSFSPLTGTIAGQVESMVRAIGTTGDKGRKLGFIVGPLAFDDSDERIRRLMRDAFAIALEKDVATGFHIDDSMFWDRRPDLNKPENIEWLDWSKIPGTGRRLDWSSVPTRIMPQLCLNSPAVEDAVRKRAALIGEEVVRGMKMLRAAGRENLFLGVFAGWETQMGRDFETGKYHGHHALMNQGYSALKPPADIDQARVAIIKAFVDLWAASLAQARVPDDKIYAHVAFLSRAVYDMAGFGQPGRFPGSYLEAANFTPPGTAFGAHHRAGFSTYPQFGLLEQIQAELERNGNPPWASSEGTAGDPSVIEKGDPGNSMETYLGNLFNRGAAVVNIFGWGMGPPSNPFRKIAENKNAIAAYQKWLRGEDLKSDAPAQVPSPQFFDKLRKLQKQLPPYLAKNGSEKVGCFYEALGRDLKAKRYADAEQDEDRIFRTIEP